MKTICERLSKIKRPCEDAELWLGGRTDIARTWAECPRGDWLLWAAEVVKLDRALVVRAACAAARIALPGVLEGEMRPLRAIEAAEAWANDQTEANVRAARAAADAAATAAYAECAAPAAPAVARAAYAAYAAYAAHAARATDAAYVATYTAAYVYAVVYADCAADAARAARVADAIRSVITASDVTAAFARLGI